MPASASARLRAFASLSASLIIVAGLLVAVPAQADTAPAPGVPETVSTDPLPTVQIDGIVWSQVIVGNTVYAGGSFTSARPAGSAPGTNETPRSNLLAYDVRTGTLIKDFAPVINGQVNSVAASPDGKRLYIGGAFTQVNGATRNRLAAFDTATGALVPSFAPSANTVVDIVKATNSTVYAGGNFSAVSGASRLRAAAMSASNGAVLPFAPLADGGRVRAIAISPDESKIVLAGSFTTLNGSSNPGYGMGAVSASTGALLPWNVAAKVRNGGPDSAIYSLTSDGDSVYGTGYHFGGGGNIEGAFRADWTNGDLVWVEDCHGDTYSVAVASETVYIAGHPHYCSNSGGFPQTEPKWTIQRAMAWSKGLSGKVNTPDIYGYHSWAGTPVPTLLNWWPDFNTGTVSGATQGPWSVAAGSDYVVYGGEFTRVNNQPQQGLVRFAVKEIAPDDDGPRLSGSRFVPSAVSYAEGTVRVSWQANYDRDNEVLTYQLIRDGVNASPVYTTTQASRIWYDRPAMGFTDTGLTPGSTHTYRLRVSDPHGNVAWGDTVSVTVAGSGAISDYAAMIIDDGARSFWRLGESSGPRVTDWSGWSPATASSGVSFRQIGAIANDTNTAARFGGTSASLIATDTATMSPDTFAVEAWFKTTSTAGGKIVGFGNANSGNSTRYDRHVYMDGAGRIFFGVHTGQGRIVQSQTGYNDGAWHHVVASMSSAGMQLFVDGMPVADRSDTTVGRNYQGYWRIGGDATWAGAQYFNGTIDDVAVYDRALTRTQVQKHFEGAGRVLDLPPVPADEYGKSVYDADPQLYWRLNETTGTLAEDFSGSGNRGSYSGGVTKPVAGALRDNADTAASFDGSDDVVSSNRSWTNPTTYSLELWFNSTSTRGGKLIGFGTSQTGLSSSYDRHVYLRDDGRLVFGTWTGAANTITTAKAYNDGSWHQVVATQSGAGMRLYVDGELTGTHAQTAAQNYTGFWRVGGDRTWEGSSSAYANARIDEVAVYGYALSRTAIERHYALGTGTTTVNQAPVAEFTATTSDTTVALDATASADPDGTIARYDWDFGDGQTGSGATVEHDYAAGGEYTVTLTVTDDDGATHSATRDVVVVAPNSAPTAAFTFTATELRVAFDGSGSTDADGTVASHAWTFGDGATGTGATPVHSYAAAGTYSVTLTVTDDEGAVDIETKSVTVSTAPPAGSAFAEDAFSRTVTSGLGAADIGGVWTTTGSASNYAVSDGTAQLRTPAGSLRNAYLESVSSSDTDVTASVTLLQAPSGGGAFASLIGRRIGNDDYRVRAVVSATGQVTLQLQRSGSTIAFQTLSGTTTSGEKLNIRLQVAGTGTTELRARAWEAGTSEPSGWQVTASDTSAALQGAGSVGLSSYLSGSASATVAFAFDDFRATSTATAPPAEENAAPTASFTSSTAGLTVSVDGSGSSDTDGAVVAHEWDFGDGASATGVTASHDYAEPGTYPVTLTVTDDDGAQATTTREVSVNAGAETGNAFALDAFERSVTGGLGSADLGGAWTTTSSASNYSVADGKALLRNPAGSLRNAYLESVSSSDTDLRTVLTVQIPDSGTSYASVIARRVGSDDYRARLVTSSSGSVQLQLQRGSAYLQVVSLSGLTVASGDELQVRVQAFGTSPTTLRAKVWQSGTTEPDVWQASTTDSTAALQQAGFIGLSTYVSSTAVPDVLVPGFDDLWAGSLAAAGEAPAEEPIEEPVGEQPANTAPTAEFTFTASGLTVSVDGSASSDADGTIASHAWDFGDGTTADQPTAEHTYAADGTYQVTLTVTDDDGATHAVTQSVTVSAPQEPDDTTEDPAAPAALAADRFERSSTSGWGTADTGGDWSHSTSASLYTVDGSGRITAPKAGQLAEAYLPAPTTTSADLRTTIRVDQVPSGGSAYTSVIGRRVGTEDYRARVVIAQDGSMSIRLQRSGTTLALTALSGMTYTAGEPLEVRLQVLGTGTTTLRAKVWRTGTEEPTTWQVSTTDTTAALQQAGHVGVGIYIGGGVTSIPIGVVVDDFLVTAAG